VNLGELFSFDYDSCVHLESGDILTFEISGVYQGSKYQDVALSEFVIRPAPN